MIQFIIFWFSKWIKNIFWLSCFTWEDFYTFYCFNSITKDTCWNWFWLIIKKPVRTLYSNTTNYRTITSINSISWGSSPISTWSKYFICMKKYICIIIIIFKTVNYIIKVFRSTYCTPRWINWKNDLSLWKRLWRCPYSEDKKRGWKLF